MDNSLKLIWSDEFNYVGKPDPKKWHYDLGDHGWGNNELQKYTDEIENAFVNGESLSITAKKERSGEGKYTSARLTSAQSFQYGKIEVCAKLPKGNGSWPAIWLLPTAIKNGKSWPLCGEIDVMEHVGKDQDRIHVSLHTGLYNHRMHTQMTHFELVNNVSDDYHVYGIEWTPKGIDFFIDQQLFAGFEKGAEGRAIDEEGWPFDQAFYIILNLAVGGFWGGEVDDTLLPQEMTVKYVRVYELME